MATLQEQVDILREILRKQIDKHDLAEQQISELTKRVESLEKSQCSHITCETKSHRYYPSSSTQKVTEFPQS